MNILVLDVAASESGAVTILKQWYEHVQNDTCNTYYFCLSVVTLPATENIKILYFPWIKKSWLHRLFFDYWICRKLIKAYNIERIYSLQNIGVPFCDVPQTIYLHQYLPFSSHRFSFNSERKLWIYQNIISRFIFASLKGADEIIVQTNWMKNVVLSRLNIDSNKISVITPFVENDFSKQYSHSSYQKRFFFPATGFTYKNHIVVYKAAKILVDRGITDFKVIFTLTQENLPKGCETLHKILGKNFELIGFIPREQVLEECCRSVLLFPSYLETFGLPLLEARCCNTPIIAANEPFSKEILEGYGKASFFVWDDAEGLANLMERYL